MRRPDRVWITRSLLSTKYPGAAVIWRGAVHVAPSSSEYESTIWQLSHLLVLTAWKRAIRPLARRSSETLMMFWYEPVGTTTLGSLHVRPPSSE